MEEEKEESGEEGKTESPVIPFLFHRGIKSKRAGFAMITENHSSVVFITHREVEELHTEFYMSVLFSWSLCVSSQVQVFTPVNGF